MKLNLNDVFVGNSCKLLLFLCLYPFITCSNKGNDRFLLLYGRVSLFDDGPSYSYSSLYFLISSVLFEVLELFDYKTAIGSFL